MILSGYLIVSAVVFCLGFIGLFLNRNNLLIVLMSLELILLAVNTNFIAFSNFYNDLSGQVFVFFILTVAASEVAIGLAIIVLLFRRLKSIDMQTISFSEIEQSLKKTTEGNIIKKEDLN